jgi:hypothetical protein
MLLVRARRTAPLGAAASTPEIGEKMDHFSDHGAVIAHL